MNNRIIAIGARQKVYAGITMLILSLIIASIFFIIRSSLANSEAELVQDLHQVECQNMCCKKPIIEVFAEVHECINLSNCSHITFHSRTCKILHNFDPLPSWEKSEGSIEVVYDKPLYMAFTPFADFMNCGECYLENEQGYPCSAFCCENFSYAVDFSTLILELDKSEKLLPTLHQLTCDVLATITGYHIYFINRWGDSGFPELEKTTQLCEKCFDDLKIPLGDLM